MRRLPRLLLLFAAGLLLAAADRTAAPDELTRRGNAALGDDPAAALGWYSRAEERTTDPGLVAFNEAVALYRLGRYREAELHFRRCREDATGERLARLLAGLGNCLVRRSGGTHANLLDQAIHSYEECLTLADLDPALADDVRHNLELARQLRLNAKPGGEPPESADEPPGAAPEKKPDPRRDERMVRGGEPPGGSAVRSDGALDPRSRPADTDQAPPPGKGNLPPLPDTDEPAALTAEDAAGLLRLAVQRIHDDQLAYRRRAASAPSRALLDW
jgi:tetratricopeptide (TPR) repeat protein